MGLNLVFHTAVFSYAVRRCDRRTERRNTCALALLPVIFKIEDEEITRDRAYFFHASLLCGLQA